MSAKVIESFRATPSVLVLRFQPEKDMPYEPGQFLAFRIPNPRVPGEFLKRAYSFALPHEIAAKQGYEICVKMVDGGAGSEYLQALKPGDKLDIIGPYGDFVYRVPETGRGICFICTGTGISPFRSMILSQAYLNTPPVKAVCIQGVRTQDELLYPGVFESMGIQTISAVSQPQDTFVGFRGRITDYLKTLGKDWGWHRMDFYLCGNAQMILDVSHFLEGGHGVLARNIHKEIFFLNRRSLERTTELDIKIQSIHKKAG